MNKKPTVSIIIPTYNRAHLVGRAIESVLNQTYQDFEIIVVDDDSTDNTQKVVNEFQKKDKRIKYIKMNVNKGSAAARNIGIKIARGDYIAFLDSDDEWLPEKLEKQIRLFFANKNLGFVSCNTIILNFSGQKKAEYKISRSHNYFLTLLERNIICSSSSVIIKKGIIGDIGYFDENLRLAQDWEMWIRVAQKYAFDFMPEPLLKYYSHSNGYISKTYKNSLNYILQKYRTYYRRNFFVYSTRLRHDGSKFLAGGQFHNAREYFLKAIKINPLDYRNYLYLLISFMGSQFYYKLSLLKHNLINLLHRNI